MSTTEENTILWKIISIFFFPTKWSGVVTQLVGSVACVLLAQLLIFIFPFSVITTVESWKFLSVNSLVGETRSESWEEKRKSENPCHNNLLDLMSQLHRPSSPWSGGSVTTVKS